MRNFRPYKYIFIFTLLFVAGSICIFFYYPSINSNLYLGIATFIVGLFALYLYIKQQEDEKKDAANILLLEIRNAEGTLYYIKTNGTINAYTQILSTDSWNKFKHLFVEDLDRDEFEALNNFYNQAALVDKFIGQANTLPQQLLEKGRYVQEALVGLAREFANEPDDNFRKINYDTKKTRFIKLINDENFLFTPSMPIENIKNAIGTIGFITTTTIGKKLKKIAGLQD
jgi:hypothetical protein